MRRLSNGSNFLGAFVDEEDPELDKLSDVGSINSRRNSRSGKSSRRSSFRGSFAESGKGAHSSSTEQARIAEMYKLVIKMAAENVGFQLYKLYF